MTRLSYKYPNARVAQRIRRRTPNLKIASSSLAVGKLFMTFYCLKECKIVLRSRQGSNLRSQRELDFKSNALTTRPRLHKCQGSTHLPDLALRSGFFRVYFFFFFSFCIIILPSATDFSVVGSGKPGKRVGSGAGGVAFCTSPKDFSVGRGNLDATKISRP